MGNQKLRKRRSQQNKQSRVSRRKFVKSAFKIAGLSTITISGININIVLPPQPRSNHHRVAVEPVGFHFVSNVQISGTLRHAVRGGGTLAIVGKSKVGGPNTLG